MVRGKQPREQFFVLPVIRNNDIGSGRDQANPLPHVHATWDQVARDGDGRPTDLTDFLRLHDTVPEAQKLLAAEVVRREYMLNYPTLGKGHVVPVGGMYFGSEERGQFQQFCLGAHKAKLCAAGKVELEPAAAEGVQDSMTARDHPALGRGASLGDRAHSL